MESPAEIKPPVKLPAPEVKKELPEFKTLIVFGQGPVKPVLLSSELSPEQQKEWQEFKKDPLHSTEPVFRVIEGEAYTANLEEIQKRTDITDQEKEQLIETERQKWQRTGRFALNRWGRQNALAAGALLVAGDTKELILSGGKTKPKDVEKLVPQERLANWPSEAELMKDIIIARFGDAFLKKYGTSIDQVIKIEDASTNTLENFAYTINNNPGLLRNEGAVGLLGTNFHIKRIAVLSHLFSVYEAEGGQLGAQTKLGERAKDRVRYEKILKHMTDVESNEDLQNRNQQEKHWTETLDKSLAYWLGYFGYVKSPQVIEKVMGLLQQPQWVEQARQEFAKVKLNFDDINTADLTDLAENDREKYDAFRESLVAHVRNFRDIPPIPPFNKKSG